MKYLVMALLTLVSISMFAVIRTVDNNNPSAGQYDTIQAAVTAASNDDIIYVYPSNIAYAGFSVNKRLKIYGVGWNPSTSASHHMRITTLSSQVDFAAGSEYSVLSGFYTGYYVRMHGVVGNVTIENCSMNHVHFGLSASYNASNYLIKGCRFSGGGDGGYWINNPSTQTGMTISNCIFSGTAKLMYYATSNLSVNNSYIQTTTSVFFSHGSNPNFRNNYIIATGYTGTSTFPADGVIAYNMSSTALFPSGTTNVNNIALNTAFDALYHPIPGSPVVNAGDPLADYNDLDGSRNDIGAYGGPYPFRDGGITTLPTIRDINGTYYTSPSQGIQIQIEASSEH